MGGRDWEKSWISRRAVMPENHLGFDRDGGGGRRLEDFLG